MMTCGVAALALLAGTVTSAGIETLKLGNPALPALGANPQITVSGLSAGAYMAVQYHVAYSSDVTGAGVIAGGPYWCAQDDVEIATHACMNEPQNIAPKELAFFTRKAEETGTIDHLSNLKNANVYIFSGLNDTVVVPGVADKLQEFYSIFTDTSKILAVRNFSAEHAMPTNSYGNPCGYKGTPFINNCGYDGAYEVLHHLWPDVTEADGGDVDSNLQSFDQSQFVVGIPAVTGMDETGFVYVPDKCKMRGANCRLHVAFHGCLQGVSIIHDTFARHAGYNMHAEKNNIVILYPQAVATELNPKGCYDWWGYTGPDYATKLAVQIAGVHAMVKQLTRTSDA